MTFLNAHEPFDALPPLSTVKRPLSFAVLRQCCETSRALAELASRLACLSPAVWRPFLLMEAQESALLSGRAATTDDLFLEVSGLTPHSRDSRPAMRLFRFLSTPPPFFPKTPEALAMLGSEVSGDLSFALLTGGEPLFDRHTRERLYTPPAERAVLRRLLDDWLQAFHEEKPPEGVLLRLAMLAGQWRLMALWGNDGGCLGRLLLFEYGRSRGISPEVFRFSNVELERRAQERVRLRSAASGDIEGWVLFFLEVWEEAAHRMSALIGRVERLYVQSEKSIRLHEPKLPASMLAERIFAFPYTRIEDLQGVVKRQTAAVYLKRLEKLSLVRERREGRNKCFVNTRLFSLWVSPEGEYEEVP